MEGRASRNEARSAPFGTLLRFARKDIGVAQPRVLLVAPMSGHFATLLRGHGPHDAADHDVYITDWHNARDVPLRHGAFGLDDYVDHLVRLPRGDGPGRALLAVCQPCVAALAAAALMAEDDDLAQPRSLTLMAGPIDCRINPTGVNGLATTKPIDWFERNLIAVPLRYARPLRRVYPGFLQLTAFMSMNLERHLQQFLRNLYQHLVEGDFESGDATLFYEEYLAVADLPAEFYLETVETVFQAYELPAARSLARPARADARDPPHRAAHRGGRARRHLRPRPDRGRARPVHRPPYEGHSRRGATTGVLRPPGRRDHPPGLVRQGCAFNCRRRGPPPVRMLALSMRFSKFWLSTTALATS